MAPLPPSTLLLRKKQKGSSAVMLLASTNPPTQQLVRFYCDVALLQKAMAQSQSIVNCQTEEACQTLSGRNPKLSRFYFCLGNLYSDDFFFKIGLGWYMFHH
jgi:hypothetical protein